MPGKVKWLWSINGGNSNVDTSNLVTINGTQTISGSKTFTAETTINNVLHMGNHIIDQLEDPTAAQHAATKNYVDAVTGPFTKIYTTGHFSDLTDAFTQKLDYTNMQNNYRISDSSVYEVLFKQNTNSVDVYASCIIGVNSANYDNCGTTTIMPWGGSGTDSIEFSIFIKNNQFKLFARRGRGTQTTTTNWNENTIIFIRKIASGSMV